MDCRQCVLNPVLDFTKQEPLSFLGAPTLFNLQLHRTVQAGIFHRNCGLRRDRRNQGLGIRAKPSRLVVTEEQPAKNLAARRNNRNGQAVPGRT